MKKIVGVTFEANGRISYFFVPKEIEKNLKIGYNVIVETDRGQQFAKIATKIHPIDEKNLETQLGTVIKSATKNDYSTHVNNIKEAKEAYKKCQELIKKHDLDMNLLDVTYTFDRDQLIFRFYADKRIDFRNLAKDLASLYHTRIELRQIGVRDKAGEVGGLGVCGQKLCCSRFLHNFDSVSISMAKNQNLALSPNKINGICGRLLCCLKYEDEYYKECMKKQNGEQ